MIKNTDTSIEYIPRPGDRIEDNVIITAIAEGGMSRVYKVKNEPLEVIRVIKLLKVSSDFDPERLVTEARISANLNHPNIVQCYRFGKYNGEIPFIEMEYVDGTNLYYLINSNGKLPVPVVLSIVHFICKALQALHSCRYTLYEVERNGIVHRDIKPANILISKKGEVKLADFGIAKPRDLSIHTSAIQVVGSIFYLSPEQLNKSDLDFKSDIYSLGCVMYEMLAAKKAFDQNNIADIVVAKLNNNYDSSRLEECPDQLKHIVAKCLSPAKEGRYDTVEELLDEIGCLLNEYAIADPKETIRRYVHNPTQFLTRGLVSPRDEIRSRNTRKALSFLFPFVIVLSIITLFSFLLLIKKNAFSVRKPVEEIRQLSVDTSKKAPVSLSEVAPRQPVSPKTKSTSATKPQSPDTGIQKRQEPIGLSTVIQDQIETHKTLEDAFLAFRRKHYTKCIDLLGNSSTMNDTLFLCLLGSLAETGEYSQLASRITARTVHDGYYHYIQGRVAYKSGEYETASKHFLKALTVPSFHPKLSFFTHYYIAKTSEGIYRKTPNIVNRNVMEKSFERFTSRFCDNPKLAECAEILKQSRNKQ